MPMTRSRVFPDSFGKLTTTTSLADHGELAKANTSTKGIWRHVYVRYYILEKSSFFQSLVGRISQHSLSTADHNGNVFELYVEAIQ